MLTKERIHTNKCEHCFGQGFYFADDGTRRVECDHCDRTGKKPKPRTPQPKREGRRTPNQAQDEHFLITALRRRFHKSPLVLLPQFTYQDHRLDALSVCIGAANRIIGFECKSELIDFNREMESGKFREFRPYCNEFYFVAPWGMIPPDRIPHDCGLLEVDAAGRTHYTIQSLGVGSNEFIPLPPEFQKALWRRLALVEGYVP